MVYDFFADTAGIIFMIIVADTYPARCAQKCIEELQQKVYNVFKFVLSDEILSDLFPCCYEVVRSLWKWQRYGQGKLADKRFSIII
jgi:hypothetical protein